MLDLSAYEWVFGLLGDDPAVRDAALARHRASADVRRWDARPDGTLLEVVRAFRDTVDAQGRPDPEYARLFPYVVLFLRWEHERPDEWRLASPGVAFPLKWDLLRTFGRVGPTPATRAALFDLLVGAVRRRQNREDSEYWRLARRLDGPVLRQLLRSTAEDADRADDERTALRARYLLWLLDHPDERTGARVWRRWRRRFARPVTRPATAAELAAMRPAAAAVLLGDLAPAELAWVLEGLEAGPASRITAVLDDRLAADALGRMDARLAARILKLMPPVVAARLLTTMPPELAGPRMPASTAGELFQLMSRVAAVQRLAAMAPEEAGRRLGRVPSEQAATILAHLPPEVAAAALGQVEWHADLIVRVLPADLAADLLSRLPAETADRIRRHVAAHRDGRGS